MVEGTIRPAVRADLPRLTVFSENGRKFGKYWDVCWVERAA